MPWAAAHLCGRDRDMVPTPCPLEGTSRRKRCVRWQRTLAKQECACHPRTTIRVVSDGLHACARKCPVPMSGFTPEPHHGSLPSHAIQR
jgi:hypothetical protein